MATRLEVSLDEAGCDLTPDAFREMLETLKNATSPSWTVDQLLCNPDESKRYCDLVRQTSGCSGLGDELILKALVNIRKANG